MRLIKAMLLTLSMLLTAPVAWGQSSAVTQEGNYPDQILVQPRLSTGKKRIRCRIIDYTGEAVTVREVDANANKTYATSEVTRVETPQSRQQQDGLKLLAAGEASAAEAKLLEALTLDPREWVKREILADLVRAALFRGDYVTAATRMDRIFASDETTHHLELLPAVWTEKVLTKSQIRSAADLIGGESQIERLVAASILLFQPGFEETSKQILLEFKNTGHRRLQPLAESQLWRLELKAKDLSVFTIEQWQRHIERLPTRERGGPYYLLAQAYDFKLLRDEAALTYLRIPVLYPHDRLLSAQSLLSAAEVLRSAGRGQESITIYRELVARYQGTDAAGKADAVLKSLAE
ncbi:MAG: hypothetical protein HUJ26_24100 [Planctomycetaceae bacterium]|nr:hypothetical protein [Planctomycetaceae bacterium]